MMNKYLSLKDHVYNYIANEILNGTLVPEEKINENNICQELNISRLGKRGFDSVSSEVIWRMSPKRV